MNGAKPRTGGKLSPSNDDGISLVELLVGMLVLSIVSVLIVSLYSSTLKTVATASQVTTNSSTAANGMNEISRIVRAGTANPVRGQTQHNPAFVLAARDQLIMYAYVNLQSSAQTPVMVKFHVNNRHLVETTWKATSLGEGYWSFPDASATPMSTRVLATNVSIPSNGLFAYEVADGSRLAIPSAGLSLDDRRRVAAVGVTLRIQTDPADASSRITLENTVGIPNLGIARSL